MQFRKITITNLFSYYGENHFEFSIADNTDRKITVISGRNGGGKTSFLNCVKMLFLGISSEVTRMVQHKRTPTSRQFVCGIPNVWEGILNSKARASKRDDDQCSIRIEWSSFENEDIVAERSWTLNLSRESYQETLCVDAGYRGKLTGDDAEEYLEQCLPKAYVPFFFFDGEYLEILAEENTKETIKTMERLLNIRPLENIQDQLRQLQNAWQKQAQNKEKELELEKLQGECNQKMVEEEQLNQKLADLQDSLDEAEDEMEKVKSELRMLWATPSKESETKLKERVQQKKEQRDNLLSVYAKEWSRDGFLKVNAPLVEQTLAVVSEIIQDSGEDHIEIVQTLKKRLLSAFDSPPYPTPRLESGQVEFLKERILKELNVFDVSSSANSPLQMDSTDATRIVRMLSPYQVDQIPSQALLQTTESLLKLNREIYDLDVKIGDVNSLTQREQERLEELRFRQDELEKEIRTIRDEQSEHKSRKPYIKREIGNLKSQIKTTEGSLNLARDVRIRYEFSKEVNTLLKEVVVRLKEKAKTDLAEHYNRYLNQLLDSNRLIDHVKINDEFEISYCDDDGNRIGRSSISAGMKQLSATSLLWALKSVSGKNVPVIVDTPLGRIDLKHQTNLLKNYYPQVAKQVIILPTDSELTPQKRKILAPFISGEYSLHNPKGKQTEVRRKNG